MSEFIGKIGERALWFAKIIEKKDVNTHYGQSTVYSVVTQTGRYGSFFADNNDQLDVDVCFHFKGTVKSHDFNQYTNRNETKFNSIDWRCHRKSFLTNSEYLGILFYNTKMDF